MPLSEEEIQDRMTYHPPSPEGIKRHARLSASLAITNIEQAKFWASAAVARNPETR